jgi:4-hydroxy-4-methyl-2-oxoglutarate aldolase
LFHQVAIHVAQPGDVIVAQVGGDTEAAIWGELMALCAKRRGVAGLVIDGAVRDVSGMRAMQFPVFAKAVTMKGTSKEKLGWINHPIVCGGVYVRPGDIVAADDDGVVILPQERLQEVLELCRARQERERQTIAKIEKGMSTYEIQNLEPVTEAKGLVWEEQK